MRIIKICTFLLMGYLCTAVAMPVFSTQIEPMPTDTKVAIPDDLFDLHMFPGWYKPFREEVTYKGSSRLVVKLLKDGSAILNPPNEGFGWSSDTIDIHGLSLERACKLWGEPRGNTFDLMARSRLRSSDWDIFHLDTKFTDKGLSTYRLRGIDIPNPQWKTVD